ADREIAFASSDARQDGVALLLAAKAQQQRTRLAIGHPVRAGRRAVAQQLLGDDVALQEALLVAAILLGPGDADPAALAQRLAELGRAGVPACEAILGPQRRQRLLEESSHLGAQCLGLRRQVERREFQLGNGHRRLGGWMLLLCRLILGGATTQFRGSNAAPSAPPAPAHGGIRRRRAPGRAGGQPPLLSRPSPPPTPSDGPEPGPR